MNDAVFSLPRPFLFLALRSSSWNRMPEKGVEEGNKKERDLSYDRSLSNDMTRSLFLSSSALNTLLSFASSFLSFPFLIAQEGAMSQLKRKRKRKRFTAEERRLTSHYYYLFLSFSSLWSRRLSHRC